jgi:cation diffusion facilitator CzcD-associated flavoprotein CzcO
MFHRSTHLDQGLPSTQEAQKDLAGYEIIQDEVSVRHVHLVLLGTGFSGLGMAIQLKEHGYNDFVVLEQAAELGGTWRDNTYPGCACDVHSPLYSFSFAPNPGWSRVYSHQEEIRNYLRNCAERFGILPHISWSTKLLEATWHDDEQRWHLTTTQGQLTADVFISGNGPLNEPALPSLPGMERFEGVIFHSAQWQHDYDLRGKRVAVIGTGASSIQFVPQIQPLVNQLSLFQRTPAWIIPRLDHAIPARKQRALRFFPLRQRFERLLTYVVNEISALGLAYRPGFLKINLGMAQGHLKRQVSDPVLQAKLTPQYTIGCKRVLVSDDFYPALTQPNVDLVTDAIREVRAHSIVTEDGQEHEVDAIICATGFVTTSMQFPQHIRGRSGQTLGDAWATGPKAYFGTTVADFPNLFLLLGPNAALSHNSMIYMIESQVAYILSCLRTMERRGIQTVEVRPEVLERFTSEIQQRTQNTAWNSGCTSWYLDASGHNTTIWPGFSLEFRLRTRHFDPQSYLLR